MRVVISGGQPSILRNPHGLQKASSAGRSVCPLKSAAGVAFATLVSGPPCVPDELLEMMSRQAGPLLERVWKEEKACEAVGNVLEFIKQSTLLSHQLVYTSFRKGQRNHDESTHLLKVAGRGRGGGGGGASMIASAWQPLHHFHSPSPQQGARWEIELKWRLGEPIGLLTVTLGSFTDLSESLVLLLHAMGRLLLEAVAEIEELTPGDTPPLATVQEVLVHYEALRPEIPQSLRAELREQSRALGATGFSHAFTEVASYPAAGVSNAQMRIVQAALCLLQPTGGSGRAYAKLQDETTPSGVAWERCQKLLKSSCTQLYNELLELPIGSEAPEWHTRLDEVAACLRFPSEWQVTLTEVERSSSHPLQVIIRWLRLVQMLQHITSAIALETAPAPANPIADKIFDLIDANGDGEISIKEVSLAALLIAQLVFRLTCWLCTASPCPCSRCCCFVTLSSCVLTHLLSRPSPLAFSQCPLLTHHVAGLNPPAHCSWSLTWSRSSPLKLRTRCCVLSTPTALAPSPGRSGVKDGRPGACRLCCCASTTPTGPSMTRAADCKRGARVVSWN